MDKIKWLQAEYRHLTYERAYKRMGFTQKHKLWTNGTPAVQWSFTKPGYDAFGYPVGYLDKMKMKTEDDKQTNQ